MGFAHRAFVAAGVCVAVVAVAGCGSSGGRWLSQSQANRLTAQLNNVQQALGVGECVSAQRYLNDFQNDLRQLGGVNSTLVANLNQGASTIQSLTNASSECKSRTVTTPKTHTTTKTRASSTTTTTATQTVPTFTEPTTTYPTQTYTYSTPTYSTPTTSTTGGQGIGATNSTPSTTDTTSTTSTAPSTTTGNGGTGLGDTYTSTSSDTTTTATTGTTGSGY